METYTLSHFPPSVNTVHIALFEDVSNAPAIRKRLIQAATTDGEEGDRLKAEVDFGFLEGRMVRVSCCVSFVSFRVSRYAVLYCRVCCGDCEGQGRMGSSG